jgi:hypothetical protein
LQLFLAVGCATFTETGLLKRTRYAIHVTTEPGDAFGRLCQSDKHGFPMLIGRQAPLRRPKLDISNPASPLICKEHFDHRTAVTEDGHDVVSRQYGLL